MDSILGAEILKTRKRWMPYMLFLVCVVGALFLIFPGGYIDYQENEEFDRIDAFRTFAFPWSLTALLDSGQFWGSMFVGILAASVAATEYNWGTVRQVLIRGQSRSAYLATKLAAISIVATCILLAALGLGLLFSLFATTLADADITLDVPGGPSVPEMGLMVLRAALCILPYGMFAFMLAVVSRSGTMGISGIVVFLFGEAIAIAILDGLGSPGPTLADVSIGENVKSVLAVNRIAGDTYHSLAPREQPPASELADANVAALILLAHTALYAAIAFWVFERRDIKIA